MRTNFPRLEPQQLAVLIQLYSAPKGFAMGSEHKHWNRAALELVELGLVRQEAGHYELTKAGREIGMAATPLGD